MPIKLIKGGKNVILENVQDNIKKEIDAQDELLNELDKNIKQWKSYYDNKDFKGMTECYDKINSQLEETVLSENVINEARKLSNVNKK